MKTSIILTACLILVFAADSYGQKPGSKKQYDYMVSGMKAFDLGNYEEAIRDFTRLLKNEIDNERAYYNRGLAYLYTRRYEEAADDFDEVIRINPSFAEPYNNRGLAYSFLGSHEEAIKDFDMAITKDPEFTEAYINRGSAYLQLDKHDEALADFSKAIELDPMNPEAYFQRGLMHYKMANYESSIKDLSDAIDMGVRNYELYYQRANAYYMTHEYSKAIQDFTTALEIQPQDTRALNNRAMAYDKAGMAKEAIEDRRKLAEINETRFTPVEELQFVTYKDESGKISLELPEGWNFYSNPVQDDIKDLEFIISEKELESFEDFYMSGVTVTYIKNMPEKYNVSNSNEILDFWRGSQGLNSKNYFNYEVFSQKQFTRGGWSGLMFHTVLRHSENSPAFSYYEMVMANDTDIIYAYFRAPLNVFSYYQKIFDKAVSSFKVSTE